MKLLDQMEGHAWTELSYIYARLGLELQHFGETSCIIHADNLKTNVLLDTLCCEL